MVNDIQNCMMPGMSHLINQLFGVVKGPYSKLFKVRFLSTELTRHFGKCKILKAVAKSMLLAFY